MVSVCPQEESALSSGLISAAFGDVVSLETRVRGPLSLPLSLRGEKGVLETHAGGCRKSTFDLLWQVFIQSVDIFSLGRYLRAILKLHLVHMCCIRAKIFGVVVESVRPLDPNHFSHLRRTQRSTISAHNVLRVGVVAEGAVIEHDFVEGV